MHQVVCDTGPILHLLEIKRVDLLSFVGRTHIPSAVAQELDLHFSEWIQNKPEWIIITPLSTTSYAQAVSWQSAKILHGGEAESLALAHQTSCEWYLTDDAAARIYASSFGLEVHGTLGVILWAAAKGKLDRFEADSLFDKLVRDSSLWISPRIVFEAKAALNDLLPR